MQKIKQLFTLEWNEKRIYGLDILRCFAVLLVVVSHGNNILPVNTATRINYFVIDGVTIFFVLSGFLIGSILIKSLEKEPPSLQLLLNFWQLRWLRTLPLYYLSLILLIVLTYISDPEFDIDISKNFFIFCQNFFKSDPSFFPVSWSLAVEEWFYLLIPVTIFFIIKLFAIKTKSAVLYVAIAIITFTIAYRYYRYITIDVNSVEVFGNMFRGPVITRLDTLMFGVLGAYMFFYTPAFWIRKKRLRFITGLVIIIVNRIAAFSFFADSQFYYCNILFLIDVVSILLLLPFLSNLKTGKGVLYKMITSISLTSYSIYLFHSTFIELWVVNLTNLLPMHYIAVVIARYLLYWFFTMLISVLTYKFIEIPFMKIRDVGINEKVNTVSIFNATNH